MNKEALVKRLKSFAWRAGMMFAALVVAFLSESLADFNLSPQVTVVLGLVLGEISKYISNNQK